MSEAFAAVARDSVPDRVEGPWREFWRAYAQSRGALLGLGLTIARDLILAHSGRLEIDSAPGLGSRFTLWLPIPTA